MSTPAVSLPSQATSPSIPSKATPSLAKRYIDAYRVAQFQNGIGQTIKILSAVVGGIITAISLLVLLVSLVPQQSMFGASSNPIGMAFGFFGALTGVTIVGVGFVLGVLVSSQGQILKATLDGTVNSSPFLSDNERVQIMGL
jgi:hypothetical protein